jgi:hypothetical protein
MSEALRIVKRLPLVGGELWHAGNKVVHTGAWVEEQDGFNGESRLVRVSTYRNVVSGQEERRAWDEARFEELGPFEEIKAASEKMWAEQRARGEF